MIDLVKIRKDKGMKQFDLAVFAGMSAQGVNYLEKKNQIMKANFGSVVKIAKVLDIDLNLFKDEVITYDKVRTESAISPAETDLEPAD